ncbi:MAG: hypothetical protein HY898_24305 [Deltaproteobacteria bacterium]|nr:hypothetical protein [Deltaproteobacteria bacterium]
MRSIRLVLGCAGLAAFSWAGTARAVTFDASGILSFDPAAVFTESFESFVPGDAGNAEAKVVQTADALHGAKVLRVTLAEEGFSIALPVPAASKSYRLTFWIQGDCIGGAAVDYSDETSRSYSQAFPTGRITSDGWLEMSTSPFRVDGSGQGIDARMFLHTYDASQPVEVGIDAVELVEDGAFAAPAACATLGDKACGAEEVCIARVCRDARGWFPPLPGSEARDKFVTYWKQKIHDTYAPYLPRKSSMPEALDAMEQMRTASTGVEYWSKFTEVVRLLRDAHTYTRAPFMYEVGSDRPLNACFMQGSADMTQGAWASDPKWPDVLVSHVGPDFAWNLHAGDRLVAVDGIHPLAWVKQVFRSSYWAWEADDPAQLANLYMMLRSLIPLHATTITVLRCDPVAKTCSTAPEVIDVASAPRMDPANKSKLVGCDNRPSYHVAGAPADHNFANGLDDATVIEGLALESDDTEKIHGLVWNTLYGDGENYPVDTKLRKATNAWLGSRGVIQDHREGHGGTSQTANILVGFSRGVFVPMVGVMRSHANDEGPADAAEGKQIFNELKDVLGVMAGSNTPHEDIPVALLLTWDVSASDFLPYMLKGGAKVRLFGPGPTMGAFGTFYQYSYWGGLLWSISAEDSISPEGIALSGHGVIPDELVVPLQSDLVSGKDTVHDAALAWVRKELKP